MDNAIRRIRSVADYQLGKGVGSRLFPVGVEIVRSKRTGRIRYVTLKGKRLVTLRPTDGRLSLSITAAKRIVEDSSLARCLVTVRDDVSSYIAEGRSVFAKHVVKADHDIRPNDEVIVVDGNNTVLAVGRAVLSGEEMEVFKSGVAAKIRRGCKEDS